MIGTSDFEFQESKHVIMNIKIQNYDLTENDPLQQK